MGWVELLNNLDLSIIAQNGLKVTLLTPVKIRVVSKLKNLKYQYVDNDYWVPYTLYQEPYTHATRNTLKRFALGQIVTIILLPSDSKAKRFFICQTATSKGLSCPKNSKNLKYKKLK